VSITADILKTMSTINEATRYMVKEDYSTRKLKNILRDLSIQAFKGRRELTVGKSFIDESIVADLTQRGLRVEQDEEGASIKW